MEKENKPLPIEILTYEEICELILLHTGSIKNLSEKTMKMTEIQSQTMDVIQQLLQSLGKAWSEIGRLSEELDRMKGN